MKQAKEKDVTIKEDRRRQFRKSKMEDGRRNTTTYDDKDEEARSRMNKMRVDWCPEEDSLVSTDKNCNSEMLP